MLFSNIFSKLFDLGLTEYEASLIRLFDKITNGSKIEVNETGTSLFYQPGNLQKNVCIKFTIPQFSFP